MEGKTQAQKDRFRTKIVQRDRYIRRHIKRHKIFKHNKNRPLKRAFINDFTYKNPNDECNLNKCTIKR